MSGFFVDVITGDAGFDKTDDIDHEQQDADLGDVHYEEM